MPRKGLTGVTVAAAYLEYVKMAVNKIMLEPLKLILQTTSSLVFSVWVGVVKTRQLL